MDKIKGLVSVIIPNHNKDIGMILESLNNSTYKNIEILEINLGLERSAQRNIGRDRAKGEYLLFLDSDQPISPGLIQECVRFMKLGIGAVYIPEIIKTKGLFAYIRNWERQFYNGTPVDVVRFVRAEFCPKFDTELNGPEDSAWDRKVTGIRTTSRNPLYHYDNIGMIKYFQKKVYYSKSMLRYAEKYPSDQCLNFWWRCFGVFFEKGKWRRVIRRPDLMLLVWGIIFIRGLIYLNEVELGGA